MTFLNDIFESLMANVVMLRKTDGEVLDATPNARKIFQCNPDAPISEINLVKHFTQPEIFEKMLLVEDSATFRTHLLSAKGLEIPVALSIRSLNHEQMTCLMVTINDLSELHNVGKNFQRIIDEYQNQSHEKLQVETALAQAEAQYRALLDFAQVGIWQLNSSGQVSMLNPRMCELLEVSGIDELEGKTVFDFIDQDAIQLIRAEKQEGTGNFISIYEAELSGNKGRHSSVIVSGLTIFSDTGLPLYHVESFTDVTEQRRLEQEASLHRQQMLQADKMISLGILSAGIAHEINNPTNFIMLNAPLLKEVWNSAAPILEQHYQKQGDFDLAGIPYSEMRSMVPELHNGILNGAVRIRDIVTGLKNYARQDNTCYQNPVDVNEVTLAALTILNGMIMKATRHLHVEYNHQLPIIRGSSQRLEQVLINLIMNACQSLPSPDKKITLTLTENPSHVLIYIQDEGVGIPQENLKHIFDPFFTTKQNQGGTGLGLSISIGIIKEMRGNIDIASTVGQGTKVTISLPKDQEPQS